MESSPTMVTLVPPLVITLISAMTPSPTLAHVSSNPSMVTAYPHALPTPLISTIPEPVPVTVVSLVCQTSVSVTIPFPPQVLV